jgi:hypothetical protein
VVDDENRRPGRDVVAVLANFRRLDVRHWLASRIRYGTACSYPRCSGD